MVDARHIIVAAVLMFSATALGDEKAVRAEKCKDKKTVIYRAAKFGPKDVCYYFCDGTKVLKRANGTIGVLSMPLPDKDPAYIAFTDRELNALEVAEHNESVLRTPASRRAANSARAAYNEKVDKWLAKTMWPKARYEKAVKESALAVDER